MRGLIFHLSHGSQNSGPLYGHSDSKETRSREAVVSREPPQRWSLKAFSSAQGFSQSRDRGYF